MLVDISFNHIVAIIILVSLLTQILFGVGVLLWGTPSLLLLGYEYTIALSLLLPISMGISGLQVVRNFQHINRRETSNFIKFSLPLAVLGLLIVLAFEINIEWFVFGALVFGGILRLNTVQRLSNKISNLKDFMPPLIGIVHGISNLGGALLVIWVSQTETTKRGFRSTVAACYFLLALFQMVTLMFYKDELVFFVAYFLFGTLAYAVLDQFIMRVVNDNVFGVMLTLLIFLMVH
jgi:uncharacterized protein